MIVSVSEAKAYLRVEHDADDTLIESLVKQAQAAAQDYCRVAFDSDAPEPVRLAVALMVTHFYENRDGSNQNAYETMMRAFRSLLYPHRDTAKMF